MTDKQKVNKCQEYVEKFILDGLEKGDIVWQKTWNGSSGVLPINHTTKKAYRGLNQYLSWVALEQGYTHNEWLTYNQALAKFGVKKVYKEKFKFSHYEDMKGNKVDAPKVVKARDDGESQKMCPVEHWSVKHRLREGWKYYSDKAYNDAIKQGLYEKKDFASWWACNNVYYVYNIEQTTLPLPKVKKAKKYRKTGAEKIVEEVLSGYEGCPDFAYSETTETPCYIPSLDAVRVPTPEQFKSKFNGTGQLHLASTVFHELTHSTGAEKRLSRVGVTDIALFDKHKERYAEEELVAEMGACMMMQYFNLDNSETTNNSQAYVKGWLSRLSDDKGIISSAIRQSNRAVCHILPIA
jgi:antirestriction protein ArdC